MAAGNNKTRDKGLNVRVEIFFASRLAYMASASGHSLSLHLP